MHLLCNFLKYEYFIAGTNSTAAIKFNIEISNQSMLQVEGEEKITKVLKVINSIGM